MEILVDNDGNLDYKVISTKETEPGDAFGALTNWLVQIMGVQNGPVFDPVIGGFVTKGSENGRKPNENDVMNEPIKVGDAIKKVKTKKPAPKVVEDDT